MKIGILGGGQLGRMLALAAHRLGLEPLVLDPKPGCAAAAVAPTLTADYEDPEALAALGRCEVVTYESESVPQVPVRHLAERVCVRPGPDALVHTSDRLLEKQLLRRLGIPTARFRAVDSEEDLESACGEIGLPAVLKTRRFGYDGRGQRVLRGAEDLAAAWREIGGVPLILEEYVAFERETSILAVRASGGEIRFWPPMENRHVEGVLRITRAPAPGVDDRSLGRVQDQVAGLLAALGYVGVMAVEFFEKGGTWIANEIACRVHNSGHWSLEGAATSQFENHLRAIADLPLGSTRCTQPSAMLNLIGELPSRAKLLGVPSARLHVYGKTPAPGRKLGHVTVSAASAVETEAELRTLAREMADPGLLQALDPPHPVG